MKRIICCLFIFIFLPSICSAQIEDFINMMNKQEFDKIKPLAQEMYGQDTNKADYYNIFYNYYTNKNNEQRDSLTAFDYLIKYNKLTKKKIDVLPFAKSLLTNIYQTKDINKFNRYIELTQNYPDLNKEAQRIRNQLAYEKIQKSQSIEAYRNFVQSYPNAMQVDDARSWLNEHLLQYYMESSNIDSLQYFAKTTSSDFYKAKALSEIDRLSFTKALKQNTIDAYMNYIKEFPNGNYLKAATNNIEKAQYDKYFTQGNITDMIYYLDNHKATDKNYKEIFDKLSLTAMEHYSLLAMQKVQEIKSDDNLLKQFAKRYISDLNLHTINMLIETFPSLAENTDVKNAKSQAEILETLKNKPKLTLEDYKKNKKLFKNLNAQTIAKLFENFEELNSSLPKNKALNFGLNNDYSYIQFKNAENTEMNFILTETDKSIKNEYKNIKIFSQADTNGYGWYEGCNNRDIFVSLYENGVWTNAFALPYPVNSRYDECNPILSQDAMTLWFSSDRGMNFGKKDIYISVRENENDWNSWSEPMLLSQEFNTVDNDYVLALSDKKIVLSQDDNFNEENNTYLEGNTDLTIIKGKLKAKNITSLSLTKINIYDKQTLKLINVIHPNDNGFFAFLKPQKDVIMNCTKRNCFSFLTENTPELHSIENMLNKQELITIHSPFDSKGNITSIGKKNLELMAESFKNSSYLLTIGVHAVKSSKNIDDKELSNKQAEQILNILIKYGINKENIVVTGYGKENIMQGWEEINSIDIGVIQK